jgi:hypothetical protein
MKSIIVFVFCTSLIFIYNCHSKDFEKNNKQQLLDSLNCVIINRDSSSLSIIDICKVNDILNKSIIDYNSALSNNFTLNNISRSKIPLENYKKQLVPMLNENNEKVVWVNCICDDFELGPKDDWKKSVIKVYDGGNCFFNVFINLSKNNWSQFKVNDNG